jgi:CheY-like chemotaxis protein
MRDRKPAVGRILLVEDDDALRHLLVAVLEAEGYQVATARDGEEALHVLANGPLPAVILLDLVLPGMDGWEFRAHQLSDAAFAAIPIVVLTGEACTVEELLDLKADEILTKPFEVGWLLEVVARYFRPRS